MSQKFHTGDLVISKRDNKLRIIEYSYKDAFGTGRSDEYSVISLTDDYKLYSSSAWHDESEYKLFSSATKETIDMIVKFNKKDGDGAPIAMLPEIAKKLGYDSIHTYESARAGLKKGNIKI